MVDSTQRVNVISIMSALIEIGVFIDESAEQVPRGRYPPSVLEPLITP